MSKPSRRPWVRERDADRLQEVLSRLPRKSSSPVVIVMIGLPGSGKSHLAREVKRRFPAAILDSDALRQVLFEQPKHTKMEHGRLFPAIHTLMARLLDRGISVIVDATNLKEANRRPYYRIAEANHARLLLVRTWAPRREVRRRLGLRETRKDADDRSTATVEVFEKMLPDVEPIRRHHISVNTSKDLRPAVDNILRHLSAFER